MTTCPGDSLHKAIRSPATKATRTSQEGETHAKTASSKNQLRHWATRTEWFREWPKDRGATGHQNICVTTGLQQVPLEVWSPAFQQAPSWPQAHCGDSSHDWGAGCSLQNLLTAQNVRGKAHPAGNCSHPHVHYLCKNNVLKPNGFVWIQQVFAWNVARERRLETRQVKAEMTGAATHTSPSRIAQKWVGLFVFFFFPH